MKPGERIIVERLPNGLYKVSVRHKGQDMIGAAASTILTLTHEVFIDEATEVADANPR